MATSKSKNNNTTATIGLEVKLWAAADALRNNMDAAEYKHVVLGLFEAKHAELTAQKKQGADPLHHLAPRQDEPRHPRHHAQIAHGDTFHNDRNPDLKADYVLANPPFNDSDWSGELLKDDKRWVYGTPPAGNANYAWVQHFVHHLAPTGLAGFASVSNFDSIANCVHS